MSLCFRLLLWCHLRCGAEIHHCRVVPERDPDMTAVRLVRLCVAPADWASISQRDREKARRIFWSPGLMGGLTRGRVRSRNSREIHVGGESLGHPLEKTRPIDRGRVRIEVQAEQLHEPP